MDWKSKNVLVTGGNGFLGSRLVKILKEKNTKKIVIPDSKKYDLRNVDNCASVLKEIDIDISCKDPYVFPVEEDIKKKGYFEKF